MDLSAGDEFWGLENTGLARAKCSRVRHVPKGRSFLKANYQDKMSWVGIKFPEMQSSGMKCPRHEVTREKNPKHGQERNVRAKLGSQKLG